MKQLESSQQRVAYGFTSWVAEEGAAKLPPEFVETVVHMGGELPPYYSGPAPQYILTGTMITDRAAAEILDSAEPMFPWITGPPVIAVDGRMITFLYSHWAESIDGGLIQLEDMMDGFVGVRAEIRRAHDALVAKLTALIKDTQAVVDTAEASGVPLWSQIMEGGAFVPTYVMTDATLLEDWAQLYIDAQNLVIDAQASLLSNQAEGLVAEYAAMSTSTFDPKRPINGPMLVGWAALGLTAFGIYMAVVSGKVSE